MKDKKIVKTTSDNNFGYFLGLIGAAVFYVQQADGFWAVIGAFLKALVWPAFVVYDLLRYIS